MVTVVKNTATQKLTVSQFVNFAVFSENLAKYVIIVLYIIFIIIKILIKYSLSFEELARKWILVKR